MFGRVGWFSEYTYRSCVWLKQLSRFYWTRFLFWLSDSIKKESFGSFIMDPCFHSETGVAREEKRSRWLSARPIDCLINDDVWLSELLCMVYIQSVFSKKKKYSSMTPPYRTFYKYVASKSNFAEICCSTDSKVLILEMNGRAFSHNSCGSVHWYFISYNPHFFGRNERTNSNYHK